MIKILDIIHDSIVDGNGLRIVIFFSGCSHHCYQCHNPQSWDVNNGVAKSTEEIINEIKKNSIAQGVSFSGGDPFYQAKEIKVLAEKIKQIPMDIWIYTGYTFEEIISSGNEDMIELLKLCDVLVDGKYIHEMRDIRLAFRGSSNQRIIDIQKSLQNNKIILAS